MIELWRGEKSSGRVRSVVEIAVTADDVIEILQRYKPAAQKVFRGKVNLSFCRDKKEILFEIPSTGNFSDKHVVYKQISYRTLGLEELIVPVAILRLVDGWIEALSCPQAEGIFWRYINHDFEIALDEGDWRIRYKTLSYEKIAEKMGVDVKTVWIFIQRGLKNIVRLANAKPEILKIVNPLMANKNVV
jgi:hypothetical protein